MQRRSQRVKAALDTATNKVDVVSDAVNIGASTLSGSPVRRSQRVLVHNNPCASPCPEHCSLKENKKRKVPPTKVNKGVKKSTRVEAEDPEFDVEELEVNSEDEEPVNVRSPVKLARGKKDSIVVDEGDLRKFNITVRCSLKEIVTCARILKERHVARVHKIDPDTMTLDMGEANKRLRITSDGIQQLFGFPRGSRSTRRPSEDGYDDALMRLRSELGISRSQDIKTKDLRDKLRVLVNDPTKDDLALRVFFIIVFMKVVLPSAATRVSREATMFEHLIIEDMGNMDYCQLMVDELRRAVVRYQNGVTLGKAITGCGIGPVLMYLDCLICGKVAEVDMRVPHLCFMDENKLSDLADADLIKKGNVDPRTWLYGNLPETTGGVDAGADERGVNNVSADKSKDLVDAGKAHSPTVDVPMNKDLVDSGEAHSPTVDVPVNKDPVDGDVASVDVKMPDVEQDVNVASVGGKVADKDVAATSVHGCKSSGIGSDANDNVSNSEELPPENFLPGWHDYGDALEDVGVSSTEDVLSEDDEMIVSISSEPLTDEAILTSKDFLLSNPESAGKILSSQDCVVKS